MHKDAILQGLNEKQHEAVLHGEGPALVAAGPGSGKTRCVTRRLLYLTQERGIPPQNILVITFTREAAQTMQNRFLQELRYFRDKNINQNGFVSFGTFHSFFYQIIRSIPKYAEFQLITQQEKLKIAKEVLAKPSSEEVKEVDLQRFLAAVSFYKNTGEVKTGDAQVKEDSRQREEFMNLLEMYESKKALYKRLDFDDMLYLCKKELEADRALLYFWQKRFTHILVDEFQDINFMQYEVLKLLCMTPYNLFVVGDDDQAIYGFRGSKAGIFENFRKDFPGVKEFCLSENYRCGESIVKTSKRLIEHNQHRVAKPLTFAKTNTLKGEIRAYASVNTRESYEKVANKLSGEAAGELSRQAVLFRTNHSMQAFAIRLSTHNIPFIMREKLTCIYEHFLVRDILDYFQIASGSKERSLFIRLFQRLRIPLGREALRTEQVDLRQVKEVYASGFYENRQAYEALEALERHLKQLAGMRPALGIKYILHAMEYEKYLLRKCGSTTNILPEWQQILDWLLEDAGEYVDFKSWDMHIQAYKKELEQARENIAAPFGKQEKNGIHLLTLHAAKGLEFQKVYIMNLNDGEIPQLRRGEQITEERMEEERRLFYVGMTRAAEELELHYVTGTKENPKYRSRFLEEIKEDLPKPQ